MDLLVCRNAKPTGRRDFENMAQMETKSVTWGEGGGGEKWPILVLHNLWAAPKTKPFQFI